MEFLVKLHPEISIKSKSVRKRQTMLLEQNLKTILLRLDPSVAIKNNYDHLLVQVASDSPKLRQQMIDHLACIPGIVQFMEMQSGTYSSLHDIFEQVKAVFSQRLEGKSFCVRVKRTGDHEFSSLEAERYIGGGLNQHIPSARVQLKKPEEVVRVEIKRDQLIIVSQVFDGMGGFPLPSQSDVLSLISGGFDSAVASYLMIRKGLRTHYLFFNLGGAAHETGVRQMAFYLWQKFSLSHKVKFISVDFAPVVTEILEKVDNGLMGVVLKRQMMRAAAIVAERIGVQALVTGESVGQVASQTIANLSVIDKATDTLVLRPLIYQDKQEIIDLARKIGAEDMAKTMPEYCGVISNKPTINADLNKVLLAEQQLDLAALEKLALDANVLDIRTVEFQAEQQISTVLDESAMAIDAIILDIRGPDEVDVKPLTGVNHQVQVMPFYKLASQFSQLDQTQQYYLYCERGVMSRLQALLLSEQGHTNVGVYRGDF